MVPGEPDERFARRGPYAVGLVEVECASAADPARLLPTSVWYPARAGASARDDAPHVLGQPHRATLGLPAHPDEIPLVVFSHGNAGTRQQSTFLTSHLASWGLAVAAPDHLGNTFVDGLQRRDEEAIRAAHHRARRQRPLDLLGVVRALLERREAIGPDGHEAPLRLRGDRLAALGHSFGGWTALKLPRLEPAVRAVCALAPAAEPFVGRRAFEPDELPLPDAVASLVIAARDDVLVDLESSIRPLHARLGPKARLELLERADHFHFCDGIAMLHELHENTERPGLRRRPRPGAELMPEAQAQAWLAARVTAFLAERLGLGDR